jgi:PAS domain S-box-containing protein
MLGPKNSKNWRELKELIATTLKYKNELVIDYPQTERVMRFQTEFMEMGKQGTFVLVNISDVTDQWYEEKQSEILEHTASTLAQNLPTEDWLHSLLNKIVILMKVKSCSIMLYDPQTNELETIISSSNIPKNTTKFKLGEGIAGLAAAKRIPIAVANATKEGIYKPRGRNGKTEPASFLALPMVVGKKLVGVLSIRGEPNKFFREQDRVFYSILASRIAITLEYRSLLSRLQEEHERLQTVINNSVEGMVLLDTNNAIVVFNPAFQNLIGKTAVQVRGQKIGKLLPEVEALIQSDKNRYHHELELVSLPGKPWVTLSIAELTRPHEQNTVLTIRDITADKKLDQMKEDFIATATHELRTPLTAILGYLSMIAAKSDTLTEKQHLYLKRIGQAGERLSVLVEDLLSVLKLDQDRFHFGFERLKLLPVIKEVIHSLEPKMLHKNISVTIPTQDFVVYADPNALNKVLVNLTDNAIKYSRPNSRIQIDAHKITFKGRKFIEVTVTDSGVGIPEKDRARLFDKFYRVPNELSVEAGGTGLGLYISKKFVESWGGNIALKSSGQKGTVFCFTIPVSRNER